ncbi:uncharacterized protein LOC110111942 [Dendrobium catenatum]|uniref:uncharacterized protein LOC110111942 n=1 Tax=Dendrobium catenatum TaxID=906689 RepID=UPI0009F37FE1|nr:uncharacterized protein LOC110111942 [Dendrobium catenatum]
MDHEPDATDGNTDGHNDPISREVPTLPSVAQPTGGSSTTMDTFNQMMAAVTHLIQHSQEQPQTSSRREPVVDKYLKIFQDMRPPLFTRVGEPVDVENWLLRVEKILEGMQCPDERRVTLATFALDGEVERWWRGQSLEKFRGRPDSQILWEDFVKVFRDWFIPPSVRSQMQERFLRLVQGERTVMQYESEFTTLSRYASPFITTTEDKCQKFLAGLRDAIRQPLLPFTFDDYAVLVEKARRLEIDFQAVQKMRDFQQKRKGFERTRSFQTHSGGSSVKKTIIDLALFPNHN